jgi:hypothetical protein
MRLSRSSRFLTFAIAWIAMMALRQDPWFARDPRLVLGVVPVGLAYQIGITVVTSLVMAVLVRVAWPAHLEALERE